jgi:hypothetical protein
LAGNQAMMRVFHAPAEKNETQLESGVYHVRFGLAGNMRTKSG